MLELFDETELVSLLKLALETIEKLNSVNRDVTAVDSEEAVERGEVIEREEIVELRVVVELEDGVELEEAVELERVVELAGGVELEEDSAELSSLVDNGMTVTIVDGAGVRTREIPPFVIV